MERVAADSRAVGELGLREAAQLAPGGDVLTGLAERASYLLWGSLMFHTPSNISRYVLDIKH